VDGIVSVDFIVNGYSGAFQNQNLNWDDLAAWFSQELEFMKTRKTWGEKTSHKQMELNIDY
jgi:hypothetical protein